MTKTKTKVLEDAPPPWHSVVLLISVAFICMYCLPTWQELDEIATPQALTHVLFPHWLTKWQMAWIRLLFGGVILGDSLLAFFWGKWDQSTDYEPHSKLKEIPLPFRGMFQKNPPSIVSGFLTLSSFTMWAWMLEGLAFLCLGLLTLQLESQADATISPWMFRFTMVVWTMAMPNTILVSAIVKYVLWPGAIETMEKTGDRSNLETFQDPLALLEHNGNVIFALVEVGLLGGGLPIRFRDVVWAPLFGVAYVVFSWSLRNAWSAKEDGPQFMYPFLDTTLGWQSTIALAALLAVLLLSHCIFAVADHFLMHIVGGGLLGHFLAVLGLLACVCRFR